MGTDLLDEYNRRCPEMLGYSLFKENRTRKEWAYANTKKILSDSYTIDIFSRYKKCQSGFKESVIYYLAKHHRIRSIYLFVRLLSLGEPIYRIMRLRK